MSLITVSSDLGENNFSVTYILAHIREKFPQYTILPLFQQEDIYDLEGMAYHVRGALRLSPEKSIHLVICKYSLTNNNLILTVIHNQFVISSDNGMAGLISDDENDIVHYKFTGQLTEFDFVRYLETYTKLVQAISDNSYPSMLESSPSLVTTRPFHAGLMIHEDRMIARVVSISATGSIILNLDKKQFYDTLRGRSFYIFFVTIKISVISDNYKASQTNNKMGAIFNESGFLEIFMIGGNVAKLFNINKYSNNKIEIIIGDDKNSQIKL